MDGETKQKWILRYGQVGLYLLNTLENFSYDLVGVVADYAQELRKTSEHPLDKDEFEIKWRESMFSSHAIVVDSMENVFYLHAFYSLKMHKMNLLFKKTDSCCIEERFDPQHCNFDLDEKNQSIYIIVQNHNDHGLVKENNTFQVYVVSITSMKMQNKFILTSPLTKFNQGKMDTAVITQDSIVLFVRRKDFSANEICVFDKCSGTLNGRYTSFHLGGRMLSSESIIYHSLCPSISTFHTTTYEYKTLVHDRNRLSSPPYGITFDHQEQYLFALKQDLINTEQCFIHVYSKTGTFVKSISLETSHFHWSCVYFFINHKNELLILTPRCHYRYIL